MASFFSELTRRGEAPSTRLSRYTERCGIFYIALGVTYLLWPSVQVSLGMLQPFQGQEEALVRVIGFTLAIIGYFYVFGGRSHHPAFGLSTVLDRLLVPAVLFFIYQVSTIELMLIGPLALLDPLLGIGAYVCWRRDEAQG